MRDEADPLQSAFEALCEEYRTRCLWFLRADYKPGTTEERLRVLKYIERYGDLEAFRRVAPFRKWLSLNFKDASAT